MKIIQKIIADKIKEMTTTGTGAGMTPGPNPPIATTKAFKEPKVSEIAIGSTFNTADDYMIDGKQVIYKFARNNKWVFQTVDGKMIEIGDKDIERVKKLSETKDVEPKLAAGKVKDNYAVSHFGYKLASRIPNRRSKMIDYKQLFELPEDKSKEVITNSDMKATLASDATIPPITIPKGSKVKILVTRLKNEPKITQIEYNGEKYNVAAGPFLSQYGLDEVSTFTKSKTNAEELARVEASLAKAHEDRSYSVMSYYEFRIEALQVLVSLEKQYNILLPTYNGPDIFDYLNEHFPGFKGKFSQRAVRNHIESFLKPSLDESMLKTTQEKLEAIREKNKELYDKIKDRILNFVIAAESYDEDINAIINKELSPVGLNENYARFRNQTSKRDSSEQLHKAVKEIKKKLMEVDKLVEYTNRLRAEISEGDSTTTYSTHTERALETIMEMIKHTYIKAKKLK